jgi:hypothetical protein
MQKNPSLLLILYLFQSSIASIYKHTLKETASKVLASSILAVTSFSHYERSKVTALTVITSMQTCDTREVISPQKLNIGANGQR